MAVTLNVDQMTTDTQELYLRTVEDQIHDRIPLIFKLKRMNRVVYKGGTYFTKPVQYGKNTQTQNYVKGETLDSGTESKRTAMKFRVRYCQTPIKFDVDDEIMNDGESQIVDTQAEETKIAQQDMLDKLSENFFGIYDGTNVATTATGNPLSIPAALTHDTTYGGIASYGGLTRSAQADWACGQTGNDSANAVTTAVNVSYSQLDYMVDACVKYQGKRTNLLAICGSVLYRKWKSLVRASDRNVEHQGDLAKAGFAAFSIDGIEFVLDDNCPASYFYMLDLSKWEWRISTKRNFKVTPFKWQGENNNGIDEYLARVLLAHNLVCWKSRNNYMTTAMS